MALSVSDKREIEIMVRKEIKDFLGSNTVKQHEEKLMDMIKKDMKNGKLRSDINDYIAKAFTEFYYQMWMRKNNWESSIKNLK
jgi:hypothetical protein